MGGTLLDALGGQVGQPVVVAGDAHAGGGDGVEGGDLVDVAVSQHEHRGAAQVGGVRALHATIIAALGHHGPMDDEGLLEAAADNLAGWHRSSVAALGFPSTTGPWWWTSPSPGPWIYFTAILRRIPDDRAETARRSPPCAPTSTTPAAPTRPCATASACSTWRRSTSSGACPGCGTPARRAPPPSGTDPDDLTISVVRTSDDLDAFEQATCVSFGAPPPLTPFEIHAPGDPRRPRHARPHRSGRRRRGVRSHGLPGRRRAGHLRRGHGPRPPRSGPRHGPHPGVPGPRPHGPGHVAAVERGDRPVPAAGLHRGGALHRTGANAGPRAAEGEG